MKNNLYIPDKIHVGFQSRNDTYTGKLAYVVPYAGAKIRKEKSFNGWRDHEIESVDCDNVPVSGFVINKKAGDYSSHWNHRSAVIRIYDPRDFEFEISVDNLLYILSFEPSEPGKGLGGEYVYSWDKEKLVLMPASSADYGDLRSFNDKLKNRVTAKKLQIGHTYLSKQNKEYVYLGVHTKYKCDIVNYYVTPMQYGNHSLGAHYWFMGVSDYEIRTTKVIGDGFIEIVSQEISPSFSAMYERVSKIKEFSPIDNDKTHIRKMSFEEFSESHRTFVTGDMLRGEIFYYGSEYSVSVSKKSGWERRTFNTLQEVYDAYEPQRAVYILKNGQEKKEEYNDNW